MLGCAIAERLFAKKNSLLSAQSLARKLWSRENHSCVSSLIRGKSAELNYGKLGVTGVVSRVHRNASYCSGGNLNPLVVKTRGYSQTKPYDIETNLPKDVILYKYENPKYFKRLNIFAISQLLFWSYLSHFVYTELRDVPVSQMQTEDLPWWRRINFGEKTHRAILTCITFLVGYSLFALGWLHTLKSVRYLVLRKGGKDITFVTYTPFGGNRLRTVPLDKMTSKQSRGASKVQLPIKVKGDVMHYLLDMRGEFRHPKLFDFTAGLKREI